MSLLDMLQQEDKREQGRVEGVAIGLVTSNQDDQQLGRIKVKYPWREDGQDSYWARPARPYGGKERGDYMLPEVGDEVLLAFDKGDIQHPFVLGVLWNGNDKPPETNADGKNDIKLIRTRCGHEIRWVETAGKESVEIKSQAGSSLKFDDGGKTVTLKDSSGSNKITIDIAANSLTIESGTSLKIKSQTIDIEAGASMTIKASGTLTIQGALVRIN